MLRLSLIYLCGKGPVTQASASWPRLNRVLFTFNGGYHFLDAIQTRSGRGSLCDRALTFAPAWQPLIKFLPIIT